jgi:hypothetical protein
VIENFTPQPYLLHAVERGGDIPLLVIGWTGSAEIDEHLRPVVVFNNGGADGLAANSPLVFDTGEYLLYSLTPIVQPKPTG